MRAAKGLRHVVLGHPAARDVADAVRATAVPGFDLLPASMDLLGIEVELADNPRRLHRLADSLAALPDSQDSGGGHYQYVLIDCPFLNPPEMGISKMFFYSCHMLKT